jgi:hypothetical protein
MTEHGLYWDDGIDLQSIDFTLEKLEQLKADLEHAKILADLYDAALTRNEAFRQCNQDLRQDMAYLMDSLNEARNILQDFIDGEYSSGAMASAANKWLVEHRGKYGVILAGPRTESQKLDAAERADQDMNPRS